MQTVKFRAGDSEGEDGNTAFLISGSVEVRVGQEAKAKTVSTLSTGEVFGEMCLIDRIQIAAAEIGKAEQVLEYMLRPSIGDCLNLWSGKSEQTDQDILNRFGTNVVLADVDEVGHRAFEFKYLGPDGIFAKTQKQPENQGYIRIGDSVPNFTAESSMGPINFHEFIGDSWCVFFSHPADFTPVCTTEFGVTAKLLHEWSTRGTKVIGLSVDSADDRARWIADIDETQHTQVNFPIIADKDRRVSMLFGMLDSTTFRHGSSLGQTMTVRSVFIISPSKRVELILTYPAYVGRNLNEILSVLDALQLSAKYRVATPANWQPGNDTVVLPFISDEEAERMFAHQGGFRNVRSCLRLVRDPSLRCL